jgi:outer membrane protein assembly factor BamB
VTDRGPAALPLAIAARLSSRQYGGAALSGNLVLSPANYPPRIVATDKDSGKVVWETNLTDGQPEVRLTAAPLPIKDRLIVGASGGDSGVRDWTNCVAGHRIRTSMCKVKILLFEKSQRFGFAQASADPCASQDNNLLYGGWIACRSHAPSSSGAPSGPGPLAHRSSNLLRRQCRILRH